MELRTDLSKFGQGMRMLAEPIRMGYICTSLINEKHLHIEPVVASHSHYRLPAREGA